MPSANDLPYIPPVLLEVQMERNRQDGKWGAESDDRYNPLDWHEIIADYNGWARRMLCMGSIDKGRRRLIQIAALAVAQVEALDRRFPRP
jgi:hypothetical protein